MVNSLFVQARDLRMHYLQQGSGEPVIFLHGFPETSYEWRKQFAALSETYACFAPDLRGFGGTEKPGLRVSRQILAQDVVSFMDAIGIERAAVVAHDWGGIVAFKLAIDWPGRVTRLALLDTLCTVWAPGAIHGYWFKAEPYPEEFFARYHAEFIAAIFGSDPGASLPGRPFSPWHSSGAGTPSWATGDDIAHYQRAFADPMSHAHAISYYRDALPFHVVHPDSSARHGERYEFLGERQVAGMWTHPEGLENHPLYANFLDFGPEDRHKRFENPVLWMFGTYLSRSAGSSNRPAARVPSGNPFADQFPRYFPDLRVRTVNAGHFFPEEAPEITNETLAAFLSGAI
ncbi:MAG: alpha/beta fold hydrolase [Dehalococcoidia bacterium]|nr:alpha/beta fold hydrolase [Dehalococcoidia bacterium]